MAQTPELGITNDQIVLQTSEENRLVALALVEQATRTLDIISRQLDPPIFDTPEFADVVRALAVRSRHSRIRILLLDPHSVVTGGHRLLELAGRLSSFIELRQPGLDHAGFNQSIVVVDKTGLIQRQLSDRYEGMANFNDSPLAGGLSRRFDDIWEHGVSNPNFRRMNL